MKFSFILLLFLLTSERYSVICDNVTFSDTCDYFGDDSKFLCGDVCLDKHGGDCDCAGQMIDGYRYDKYCCAPPSVHCTKNRLGDGKCLQGEVLSRRSLTPCNATGRCYNDYRTSKYLGYRAHYTCQDLCIPWRDIGLRMCQGVSFCDEDEEQLCGPQLRCPDYSKRYSMSTVPLRYYCYDDDDDDYKKIRNNGSYDLVDRSDENITVSITDTFRQNFNFTALAPCTDDDGDQGVMCDGECRWSTGWCNNRFKYDCQDSGVITNDPTLCANHTFWENISCDLTWNGQFYSGKRCTGSIKHCYFPLGSPFIHFPTTCKDKSDRVFKLKELQFVKFTYLFVSSLYLQIGLLS